MKRTPLIKKTRLARKPLKRTLGAGLKRKRSVGTTKPKKKPWKFKQTELDECDAAFSREIRERDKKCQFPGCQVEDFEKLQCSHYIGRAIWNTRFDPQNCIALCWFHHFKSKDLGYEYQKQRVEKHGWDGQYTIFQRNFLGEKGFNDLLERAEGNKSRKQAILETQQKYGLRQPTEQSTLQ